MALFAKVAVIKFLSLVKFELFNTALNGLKSSKLPLVIVLHGVVSFYPLVRRLLLRLLLTDDRLLTYLLGVYFLISG